MRAYEERIVQGGLETGLSLMEKAAEGVARYLMNHPIPGQVLIVCGGGNNGGDGLALLRLLHQRGVGAAGVLLADPGRLKGDAAVNYRRAVEAGCRLEEELSDALLLKSGWVVDALFGTGLNRPIEGRAHEAITRLNASGKPVLAVDLPSGVDGDTGHILGTAVEAAATVTFEFLKRGHLLFPGRGKCGKVTIHPLTHEGACQRDVFLLEEEDIRRMLPKRPLDSQKGENGRALLCAGSGAYTGAAMMSAASALRAGCGVLTVAVPWEIKPAFAALPEVCCRAVGNGAGWNEAALQEAAGLLMGKHAAGIGPGMGVMANEELLTKAIQLHIPLVVDADGLNFLASHPKLIGRLHENVLLTPHPGEMARLTGRSLEEILGDPMWAAREFAGAWGCNVLLKGATTCISDGNRTALNITGNPGLAKGGSGDVLTGMILGLMVQGLSAFDAGCAGSFLLGTSADQALAILGDRALTAGDVISALTLELKERQDHLFSFDMGKQKNPPAE